MKVAFLLLERFGAEGELVMPGLNKGFLALKRVKAGWIDVSLVRVCGCGEVCLILNPVVVRIRVQGEVVRGHWSRLIVRICCHTEMSTHGTEQQGPLLRRWD